VQLSDCTLFFGEWPETIAFVAVLTPRKFFDSHNWSKIALQEAATGAKTQIWPALGCASFNGDLRPRELKSLCFNGDGPGVADFTDRTYAGFFLGGSFIDVVSEVRRVRALLARALSVDITVEIGTRFAEGRGHGGFIDGISNLQELTPDQFSSCVFVGGEDPSFAGGSYAVIRKYEENVDLWTDLPDVVQEQILGRHKSDGHLLGGERFWRNDGSEAVLESAHVSRARPNRASGNFSWHDRLYRRSFNYTESHKAGTISQGLVFLTLNRCPALQIERIHNEYMLPDHGSGDLLMTSGYVRPVRTFLVFVPPTLSFGS
jgi:Dyp-type peroxidase family